ncbi:alpha-1,2-mannosidase family domain protein [Mycobacterium avium subsp. avium 2285 (R)]|nr:alpha-1,2-mannosidase family domain protein [Mycobacterium avium subsp. avium 2285 (R)]
MTAELTATAHTGVGRFSYPGDGRPALLQVRSGSSLAGNSRATIQLGEDNTTITGWATSGGFCDKPNAYTVYFAMKFNRPFISYGSWDGSTVYPGPAARTRRTAAGMSSSRPARCSRCAPRSPTSASRGPEPTWRPRATPASTTSAPPRPGNGTPRFPG